MNGYVAGRHPDWCAQGHGCNLGEHRAQPITFDAGSRGVMVLTRVLSADGSQHVEIRTRIALATGEANARLHLTHVLTLLNAVSRRLFRLQ